MIDTTCWTWNCPPTVMKLTTKITHLHKTNVCTSGVEHTLTDGAHYYNINRAAENDDDDAALPSKDLECGTVFLLNCIHQTSRWQRSETDLRHSCSICNCHPVHLQLLHDLALYKCT